MSQALVTRRSALRLGTALGAGILATPFISRTGLAADEPIKLGSLLDGTGAIGIEGRRMIQTTEFAVAQLNAAGGLLGRQIKTYAYDTQSNMQLYSQYAQQLALKDKVDVIQGGITSASREAVRPTFDRAKILYFYNTQYEGGVCDRNVFCTGTTPAQTVEHVVAYALKTWGKKAYIIAADYNYGQITAKWMTKFARDGGGSVAATDFFPLDVTNFASAISRIQQAAPDFVLSALVGANHSGFYRQWDAAGMKAKIPLASSVFGLGDELQTMDTSTTNGIVTSFGYYKDLGTPASDAFIKGMQAKFGADVTDLGGALLRDLRGHHAVGGGREEGRVGGPAEGHRRDGERHHHRRPVRDREDGPGDPPHHPQRLPGAAQGPEVGADGNLPEPASVRHRRRLRPAQGAHDQQAVRARHQGLGRGPDTVTGRARMDLAGLLAFDVLAGVATLVLITLGLGVIYGMMRIINLAHGEFMMLGAYTAVMANGAGVNIWVAMLVLPPLVVGLVGLVLERTLIRFLYGRIIDTMLATWGVSLGLIGLITTVFGNVVRGVSTPVGSFSIGRYGASLYSVVIIVVAVAALAGMLALLRGTRFGLVLQATMQNPRMAAALGVSPSTIYMATFALGSALAGLAGGVLAPISGVSPAMGGAYIAKAFITVLGGGPAIITRHRPGGVAVRLHQRDRVVPDHAHRGRRGAVAGGRAADPRAAAGHHRALPAAQPVRPHP